MTLAKQGPSEQLAGLDLQPIAQLSAPLEELAARFDVAPERDTDDLGSFSVSAVTVDGARYLLRSFDDAPSQVTEVHCAETGDPVAQLRALLRAVDLSDVITHWWDGSTWHDEPVDPTA